MFLKPLRSMTSRVNAQPYRELRAARGLEGTVERATIGDIGEWVVSGAKACEVQRERELARRAHGVLLFGGTTSGSQ